MAIEKVSMNGIVLCDDCNEDYTNREDLGGILFVSKAICPECVPAKLERIRHFDEEGYIRDWALEGESFKDFVYRLRIANSGSTEGIMEIRTGKDAFDD